MSRVEHVDRVEHGSYNPDVLSCLANLSNDEVFTPPAVVNAMLDLLPQELFASPKTRFLDPAAKSGVFLREIAKRLIKGLEREIPDLQKRVDHILHNQVFGIATTELTSLVSRRTLYCSKYPNCRYSVSTFDAVEGNIRFRALRHTFVKGRCKWCGASESQFDRDESLESHAYEFIHNPKPQEIFNMKFDVIIGNPPYQMADGGGMQTDSSSGSAIPIYDRFVEQAMNLNPRYLVMIIPARWYSGGRGLNVFRQRMFEQSCIKVLVDYFNSDECFPGVDISGGICYFLWEKGFSGECEVISHMKENVSKMRRPLLENKSDTFIRFNSAVGIVRKVHKTEDTSLMECVSSSKPFGMRSNFSNYVNKADVKHPIRLYRFGQHGFVSPNCITASISVVNKYKVFIAKAFGERGDFPFSVIGKPFIGEPQSCCTETYLYFGPFQKFREAENLVTYLQTRFVRFLILMRKNTQNAARGVYQLVPLQDFSKPWTDEELYKKYNLTKDEIAFIERMIKPME